MQRQQKAKVILAVALAVLLVNVVMRCGNRPSSLASSSEITLLAQHRASLVRDHLGPLDKPVWILAPSANEEPDRPADGSAAFAEALESDGLTAHLRLVPSLTNDSGAVTHPFDEDALRELAGQLESAGALVSLVGARPVRMLAGVRGGGGLPPMVIADTPGGPGWDAAELVEQGVASMAVAIRRDGGTPPIDPELSRILQWFEMNYEVVTR